MMDNSLTSLLKSKKISISDTLILDSFKDNKNIRGRLAEQMIGQWLEYANFNFENNLPRTIQGVEYKQGSFGIDVIKDGESVCEFDYMGSINNINYVIEVKSFKLNGLTNSIKNKIKYANLFYDNNVKLIIFVPNKDRNKPINDVLRIKNPQASFIDSGYSKKQLNNALETISGLYNNSMNLHNLTQTDNLEDFLENN